MASCARVASASASSSPRASPPSSSRRRAPTRARHHRPRRRSTTIARDDDNANDDDVATTTSSSSSIADAEALLISRLSSLPGRGANASAADEEAIAAALAVLEADGGIARPATRDEICGTWRLLYTSKSAFDPRNPLGKRADGSAPGIEGLFRAVFGDDAGEKMAAGMTSAASSSPIQRTVTSLEAFTIQARSCCYYTGPHTTAFALCTPFLEDFTSRRSFLSAHYPSLLSIPTHPPRRLTTPLLTRP